MAKLTDTHIYRQPLRLLHDFVLSNFVKERLFGLLVPVARLFV